VGHSFLLVATAIALLIGGSHSASADRRLALTIGNASYSTFPVLTNTRKDASAIADSLKRAGFEVEARTDLNYRAMLQVLRDFAKASETADISVIYFAGHGLEVAGINYLTPIDAKLEPNSEIDRELVSLDRVLNAVERAKRLRLVILDACRDNPFVKVAQATAAANLSRSIRTVASAPVGRGLAQVDVNLSDTYVAFAAKAGSTAEDGEAGGNSPFTKALLAHLTTPGLDVRMALGRVRDQVVRETNRRQEPFVYGSLGGEIISLVPTANQPNPPSAGPVVLTKAETSDMGSLRSLHEKWQVRCKLMENPPVDRCSLLQIARSLDNPNVAMSFIILKLSDGSYLFRILGPLGSLLETGIHAKIDDTDLGSTKFVRCLPNGCIAEVRMESELIAKFRSAKIATFVIKQTPTQAFAVRVPLTGFGSGLDALPVNAN